MSTRLSTWQNSKICPWQIWALCFKINFNSIYIFILRGLNDYRMLIYSIVLIVMMLFNWAPKCIEWREKVAARFKKSVKKEAE